MPVSFSSPARNLFLLGSSGADVVTNFFKAIDKSSGTDDVYLTSGIKYVEYDESLLLSGSAQDPNSKRHGWLENRTDSGSLLWSSRLESPVNNVDTFIRGIEIDSNGDLVAVGNVDDVSFISLYNSSGVLQWQSTTNTGDLKYVGVTSDSNGAYYACGFTPTASNDARFFVEKYDSNGNPLWGKSARVIGNDIVLHAIDANSRGEVVAGGYLIDDTGAGIDVKGYFVKLDASTGDVLWDRTLEITDRDWGQIPSCFINDVMIDGNDFIYIVGYQSNPITGLTAGFICKYTPEGNMLWQNETGFVSDAQRWRYYSVEADTATGQIIVLGQYIDNSGSEFGVLVKYSESGKRLFTRSIQTDTTSLSEFGYLPVANGGMALDATPSFYYFIFTDQDYDSPNGLPNRFTYGKVSSSGNGLGDFQYDDGTTTTVDYKIQNTPDRIGRLSDGSVRNDTSDLATNILNPTKIMFDDYATPIANKKRQMDSADNFEYSGSPAIRPADFQELNLLGDVYSGSGDWLDQSGKGNNAQTTVTTTTTTTLPGTTESENFASTTSSYSTYGTVAENTVTNDLPFTAAHYSGKVRDLQTGGFRIDLTGNSNGGDFFMGCWIKFDTYTNSRQMGIDLFGDYVYWETLSNGAIAVRHVGGSRADSSATSLNDGNWHHIALSRSGSTLYGFLDGTAVISTTNGVSGNSVNTNENFWFFGGSGTAYNTDAKVLDPFVYVGAGTSGYTVPTAPLIDSDGNINHFSGFSGNEEYISPAIAISGGTTTTTTTNTVAHNAAGYFEFDGDDDFIDLGTQPIDSDLNASSPSGGGLTVEWWGYYNGTGDSFQRIVDRSNGGGSLNGWAIYTGSVGSTTNIRLTVDGESTLLTSNLLIDANVWQHWMISWDQGTGNWVWYKNGAVAGTGNATYSIPAVETGMRIGSWNHSTGREYNGSIGEMRIYPRALTAAQVFQNYNATKSKYIDEAPDTAPKIGPGIVYGSNLLLNYDFGNRATYDDTQNYLLDNFASDTDTGEYFTDDVGKHKIYQADTDINSAYGSSQLFSPGTYDISVSMWMKADDLQTNQFALKNTSGSPLGGTYNFTPKVLYPDGGIISYTWSNVTISGDDWNFGVYNNNGDARTMLYARPQLTLKSSTGRYVKTYGSVITAPTTVKNLSSSSYTGTINGATFDSAGYFEFDGSASQKLEFGSTDWGGVLSIEMWIKTRETAQAVIAELVATATNHIGSDVGFRITRSGNLSNELRFGFRGNVNFDPGFTFTNNQWEHYVMTFNDADPETGSNYTSYKNGSSGTISDSGNVVLAGQQTTNELSGHDMEIGEFRIYDKVLTATEVSQNFNATRGKYGV